MSRRLTRTSWGLGPLVLLTAAALGCGHGGSSASSGGRGSLYPGADPNAATEHVFLYPLDEALAAAKEVIESHNDYDVEPFEDETQLMTRWPLCGRPTGAGNAYVGSYQLRRYYVQAQPLGPKHSVVRIFRIDREEMFRPGERSSDLVDTAR